MYTVGRRCRCDIVECLDLRVGQHHRRQYHSGQLILPGSGCGTTLNGRLTGHRRSSWTCRTAGMAFCWVGSQTRAECEGRTTERADPGQVHDRRSRLCPPDW